jgi:formate hydrogenlyase subunit 3/multisubunit Na+/H+ antiporter MnhD subunit
MSVLFSAVIIPLIGGLAALLVPTRIWPFRKLVAMGAVGWSWIAVTKILSSPPPPTVASWITVGGVDISFDLAFGPLSRAIALFVGFFALLVLVYSFGLAGPERQRFFDAYIAWAVGAAHLVLFTDNLILLLVAWEASSVLLYLLVTLSGREAREAARKSFIILGLGDCCLVLGIAAVVGLSGSTSMREMTIQTGGGWKEMVIFLLFFAGTASKAGALPLHSWIPACSDRAAASVMALLPAALDKLLGIYLLARIVLDLFRLDFAARTVLMAVGSLTIVLAVMMALVQHDARKLLAYHAVSQVGYMILGLGVGVAIAVAGGLFHMINNAIYKSALFLGAGAVAQRTGRTDLGALGGLARAMPITFGVMAIASLAISGVPPLNGFASKWMIYQGLLGGRQAIPLLAAMFGSALTLASFLKLLYSIFLGQRASGLERVREVSPSMWIPMVILALLCLAFGIFAQIPLGHLIGPAAGITAPEVPGQLWTPRALWSPTIAAGLLLVGLGVGLLAVVVQRRWAGRRTLPAYVGGERLDPELMRVPGTAFYETVEELPRLAGAYGEAKRGVFDLYRLGGYWGGYLVAGLAWLHSGVLSSYLSWCIIGLVVVLALLMR